MLTLFGSLIGFLGSIFPDILRLFHDKHDRNHELLLFDRQLKMMKLGHLSRLQEAEVTRSIAETEALYAHARPSGVLWVDALSGSVRPLITYTFFLLYAAVKISQALVLMQVMEGFHATEALIRIWHEEDQALFAAVMSFWFGSRALRKQRG